MHSHHPRTRFVVRYPVLVLSSVIMAAGVIATSPAHAAAGDNDVAPAHQSSSMHNKMKHASRMNKQQRGAGSGMGTSSTTTHASQSQTSKQ